MGTTSDKLTYLNDTKTQLKDMINYGLDTGEKITSETTFRNYVRSLFDAFIKTMTYPDVLYGNLPKVTGTGTSVTLNGTAEAPMRNILSPSVIEQRNLPNDYTEVEYIESSGTQYIDTGIKLSANYGFDIKFLTTNSLSTLGYGCIFGGRNSSGVRDYQLTTFSASASTQGTLRWNSATGQEFANSNMVIDTIQQCSLRNKVFISCNGTETELITNGQQSDYNCYLFGLNNGASVFSQSGNGCRIYYCKFYDGNNLIRNFIPCYRNSDNEIGMYDLVNDVFYTNQGTGTFAKGNDVTPSPENPQQIHVVSGENSVKVENKNLFDETLLNDYLSDGYYSFTTSQVRSDTVQNIFKNVKNFEENTQYTFSCRGYWRDGVWARFKYYYTDGTTSSSYLPQNTEANYSITSTANKTIDYITLENSYSSNSASTLIKKGTIQLEKGSTATSYEPHKEQSLPLNLGDLEYCKIGDYEDEFYKATESDTGLTAGKWYLKKNVGKVVLDGSNDENWDNKNLTDENLLFTTTVLDSLADRQEPENMLCNYFLYVRLLWDNDTEGYRIYNQYRGFRIRINKSLLNDISTKENAINSFKTWLSTHNTEVYYVLQTPTYTLLNNTLQTQLDNIQKALSYDGQTNVSQENADLPFVLSLSAIKDYEEI